ncbi:hypothetical protein Tco_0669890 [Tanacetum coccineum]
MDIEEKQEHINQFVNQASNLHGSSLVTVINDAISHPSLFAFSEILSLPNVTQLQGTAHSRYIDLLQMFAYGTWSEYKKSIRYETSSDGMVFLCLWHVGNASNLPPLAPDQILKLKQLTVLTLAETNKVNAPFY